jgi:hypothetical protein
MKKTHTSMGIGVIAYGMDMKPRNDKAHAISQTVY